MSKYFINIFLMFSLVLIFPHDLSASRFYWKNGISEGSRYYWKNKTGVGSRYYWRNGKESSYPEEPMTNVCLGLLEDGDELPDICEIYPIIIFKLDE